MKYHTEEEEQIKIRSYGRNIQQMVEHTKKEPNQDRRQQLALETIRAMHAVVPNTEEIADYKRKLWDHFFALANFDIDVESPYGRREAPTQTETPERLPYYVHRARYKQYGRSIELMVEKALDLPEGAERDQYILTIAHTMKMFQQVHGTAIANDTVIFHHLAEISKGKIQLKPEETVLGQVPAAHKNIKNQFQSSVKLTRPKTVVKRAVQPKNNNVYDRPGTTSPTPAVPSRNGGSASGGSFPKHSNRGSFRPSSPNASSNDPRFRKGFQSKKNK
jgi:hypothetical protein